MIDLDLSVFFSLFWNIPPCSLEAFHAPSHSCCHCYGSAQCCFLFSSVPSTFRKLSWPLNSKLSAPFPALSPQLPTAHTAKEVAPDQPHRPGPHPGFVTLGPTKPCALWHLAPPAGWRLMHIQQRCEQTAPMSTPTKPVCGYTTNLKMWTNVNVIKFRQFEIRSYNKWLIFIKN